MHMKISPHVFINIVGNLQYYCVEQNALELYYTNNVDKNDGTGNGSREPLPSLGCELLEHCSLVWHPKSGLNLGFNMVTPM